jgi:aminoglycoside phosphotransferase (APT) family kinase protein
VSGVPADDGTDAAGREAPGLGASELASLRQWLDADGVPVSGALRARLIAGGKSNLTYAVRDDVHHWVLRRPPAGEHTESAHDVGREYAVTSALARTNVPVAATVASCNDESVIGVPFTIVEFVDGAAIRSADDLHLLNDDTLENVVDGLVSALATLHRVDHVAAGLESFGRPDGYASRQLRRWGGQWDVVGQHSSNSVRSAANQVLKRLQGRVPPQGSVGVVHGDYRIDNTLVDLGTGAVRAIVDWELATIGDPVADVALMCVYRLPALDAILGFDAAWTSDRLPTPDDLAARYAMAGGAPLENWEFWTALSSFKLAVIAAGIDHRWRSGGTVGEGFDTASDAVEPLIDQALVLTSSLGSRP